MKTVWQIAVMTTAQIGDPAMRSLTRAQLLGVKMIRFVALALLLLALTSAGLTSLSAQGLGPIAYNKPNSLGYFDLWTIQPDGTGDTWVPITYRPGVCDQCPLLGARHPVWSRDGQLIAAVGLVPGTGFLMNRGGYAVVVFDPSGANVQAVAPLGTVDGDKAYAAFSPDGRKLAYVDGSANWSDFYVVDRSPGSQRVLIGSYSSGESDYTGTGIDWSPTADQLVTPIGIPANFCNQAALPVPVTALASVSLVGNRVSGVQLLTCPPVVFNRDLLQSIGSTAHDVHPVFSRDGRYVAFVRWTNQIGGVLTRNQVTSSILVVELASGAQQEVIRSIPGVRICGLSWSGDGTSLVFDVSQDINGVPTCGNLGLGTIKLDGSGPPLQLKTPIASSPSWSWQ